MKRNRFILCVVSIVFFLFIIGLTVSNYFGCNIAGFSREEDALFDLLYVASIVCFLIIIGLTVSNYFSKKNFTLFELLFMVSIVVFIFISDLTVSKYFGCYTAGFWKGLQKGITILYF